MNDESTDPQEEKTSWLHRWRNRVFPILPEDTAPVRMIKKSGFFLFAVMVVLISLTVCVAIMFVL